MVEDRHSVPTHHIRQPLCLTRPKYREGRQLKAVKVYTVSHESKYLLVQGVPALGLQQEVNKLFSTYGEVEECRILNDYPSEVFTDAYCVKYKRIQSARVAKRKADDLNLFGGILHVCYAPEYETVQDCRDKLQERRKVIAAKTKKAQAAPNTFQENISGHMIDNNQSDKQINIREQSAIPQQIQSSVQATSLQYNHGNHAVPHYFHDNHMPTSSNYDGHIAPWTYNEKYNPSDHYHGNHIPSDNNFHKNMPGNVPNSDSTVYNADDTYLGSKLLYKDHSNTQYETITIDNRLSPIKATEENQIIKQPLIKKFDSSAVTIKQYTRESTRKPAFVPRQVKADTTKTKKLQNKTQRDPLNDEIRRNAIILRNVSGPLLPDGTTKQEVSADDKQVDESVEKSVLEIRKRVKEFSTEVSSKKSRPV